MLMLRVFDWALIILSSLTGATLVSYAELASKSYTLLFLALLTLLGIMLQARRFRRTRLPA
jgi:uncharacterized membrane protein